MTLPLSQVTKAGQPNRQTCWWSKPANSWGTPFKECRRTPLLINKSSSSISTQLRCTHRAHPSTTTTTPKISCLTSLTHPNTRIVKPTISLKWSQTHTHTPISPISPISLMSLMSKKVIIKKVVWCLRMSTTHLSSRWSRMMRTLTKTTTSWRGSRTTMACLRGLLQLAPPVMSHCYSRSSPVMQAQLSSKNSSLEWWVVSATMMMMTTWAVATKAATTTTSDLVKEASDHMQAALLKLNDLSWFKIKDWKHKWLNHAGVLRSEEV